MIRLLLAGVHLLALGIGLSAVHARAGALREAITVESLRRAFKADTAWGIAFGLWAVSGVWRWLAGTEKSSSYYLDNHLFLTKMGLLVVILALEAWPMITLIRWRRAVRAGESVERFATADRTMRIARISQIQAAIVVIMIFLAAAMARGFGAVP